MLPILGTVERDFGTMVRIPIEGGDEELLALEGVHHDFVQHTDGTLGALFIESREGWTADADGIVELAPDGTQRVVFDAWDAFDPQEFGADEPIECWTHANALDYDEDTDTYYVSMRSLGTLLAIDGATGDVLWSFFGRTADIFATEGSGPSTDHHQFDMLDDGVLIFDNGSNERGYSAVLEYTLDLGQAQATQVGELRHDPDLAVWALGDMERLDDGGTRIGWSTSGEIQDLDADGQVTWQVNSSLGYGVGYVSQLPTFYPA